jgi:hypothetical protein
LFSCISWERHLAAIILWERHLAAIILWERHLAAIAAGSRSHSMPFPLCYYFAPEKDLSLR